MPLLAKEHLPISSKDITSWCFENRSGFDQDKPIYIDCAHPNRTISANQAYTLIRKLVAGFRAAGLQRGDCVCIHAFNNLYYPIIVQGIVAAGGCWVGTNPSYTPYELHHALKISQAKFIIAEPDLMANIKKPAAELGIPNKRIFLLAAQQGQTVVEHLTWRSLLDHGEEDWVRFDDLETAKTTNAFLLFSSGTTGLPKAAQLSHYNLIAQITLVSENPAHPVTYELSRLYPLPFFHAAAAPSTHVGALRTGNAIYIMRRFELSAFLSNTLRHQITSLVLVPPMVIAIVNLAKHEPDRVRKCLSSVITIYGGAAPLDKSTQAALQALLPAESTFTQLWAMSETSCICSCFYHPDTDNAGGSVGRFMPNIDVKLVSDSGAEINPPYDTPGELLVRGPTVIRGYLNNPEANSRDWDEDGYFRTGDILYCDSKTKLWYIVDRKKELIKVRGFQVAPGEIEGVLVSHRGIRDAAVIGVPSGDASGEVPRAYVVRNDGAEIGQEEVHRWVEERLAGYKRLIGGVKFVDAIPKNASGKILKRVLREQAKKEMSARL